MEQMAIRRHAHEQTLRDISIPPFNPPLECNEDHPLHRQGSRRTDPCSRLVAQKPCAPPCRTRHAPRPNRARTCPSYRPCRTMMHSRLSDLGESEVATMQDILAEMPAVGRAIFMPPWHTNMSVSRRLDNVNYHRQRQGRPHEPHRGILQTGWCMDRVRISVRAATVDRAAGCSRGG